MRKVLRLGADWRGLQLDNFTKIARKYREMGFSVASCPIVASERMDELRQAFASEDVILAEVGAYGLNIIDGNKDQRKKNIETIKNRLYYAEEVGALCCVIHGGWVGKSGFSSGGAENFSKETFENIVTSIQEILDEAQPKHTKLVIETESDILPDGPEEYFELITAVNRLSFQAHFDPVNIITSPRRYHLQSEFLRKSFSLLGPHIISCHAKDILYANDEKYYAVVCIDEVVPPGKGKLDYRTFLREISKLEPSPPVIMEHLPGEKEALEGRDFLLKIADEIGVSILNSEP
jgi:sugar phosphate isomerase/epimerase